MMMNVTKSLLLLACITGFSAIAMQKIAKVKEPMANDIPTYYQNKAGRIIDPTRMKRKSTARNTTLQ
jgi:hypothetical protein